MPGQLQRAMPRYDAAPNRRQVLRLAGALAILSSSPNLSFAQSDAEINDIIRSLAPIRGQTVTPGHSGDSPTSVTVDQTTVYVDVRRSVSLEVFFQFNSAVITPAAMRQLAALGQALASLELAPHRYLIAGHTDAVGSDAYNLDLSRRRAMAVREHLISAFPIDPDRLMPVGFGFRQLKRPNAPRAAINRRVEVLLTVA